MIHAFRLLRERLRRFAADRRGNVLMIFGLSIIPLTFATGMGIDYARAMRLQTKLNAAADAAALAAVGKFATSYKNTPFGNFYAIAAPQAAKQMFVMQTRDLIGTGGLVINYDDVTQLTITPSTNGKGADVYKVSYNAESTNAFAALLGLASLHIRGSSTATTVLPTYLDIHVALDVSQSMGLAASLADAQKLYSITPSYGAHACTFGCHVKASDDGGATKANDVIATENGIRLRIDALREAVSDMIQTASDDQGSTSLYQFALYRIGFTDGDFNDSVNGAKGSSATRGISIIKTLTPDLSSAKSSVSTLPLGTNVAGGTGDTNLAGVTSFVAPNITNKSGDGSTRDKARKFFFIVTDGVADQPTPSGCRSGHCTRPIDPATCTSLKNDGVIVAVLYTTFLPIYNNPANPSGGLDGRYTSLVKAFSAPGYTSPNPADNSADIEQTLRSCATDGWFYRADDGDSIHAAMNKLFQQATQTARLTK